MEGMIYFTAHSKRLQKITESIMIVLFKIGEKDDGKLNCSQAVTPIEVVIFWHLVF